MTNYGQIIAAPAGLTVWAIAHDSGYDEDAVCAEPLIGYVDMAEYDDRATATTTGRAERPFSCPSSGTTTAHADWAMTTPLSVRDRTAVAEAIYNGW
jgi:hypothetical protein